MISCLWLCCTCGQQKHICTFNILSPKDQRCKEIGRVMLLFCNRQCEYQARSIWETNLFLPASVGGLHKEWWRFLMPLSALAQVTSDTRKTINYSTFDIKSQKQFVNLQICRAKHFERVNILKQTRKYVEKEWGGEWQNMYLWSRL